MTITDKEATQKQNALLAELRKEKRDEVAHAQALLKEQKAVRKSLKRVLQGEPRSIPDIAATTEIHPQEVLWHITAMKKYGEVIEDGMDEDFEYYLYRMAKEA